MLDAGQIQESANAQSKRLAVADMKANLKRLRSKHGHGRRHSAPAKAGGGKGAAVGVGKGASQAGGRQTTLGFAKFIMKKERL